MNVSPFKKPSMTLLNSASVVMGTGTEEAH